MRTPPQKPTILCIGGQDPSGCAGLAADARMVEHLGAHAISLTTCLTAQNRTGFYASEALELSLLRRQWRALASDGAVHGVKIGAVATMAQAKWISQLIQSLNVPTVIDPVINSSAGLQLGHLDAIKLLLPQVTLATPNLHEARQIGLDQANPACDCLITTTDDTQGAMITHRLHWQSQQQTFEVARRPGQFRGTGCLLASAICSHLASGYSVEHACMQSLSVVDRWLENARQFTDGIHIPRAPQT